MSFVPMPRSRQPFQFRLGWIIAALVLLLFFSRSIASTIVDYYWWREMGQVPTWLRMAYYQYLPAVAGWAVSFAALWFAHQAGVRHAGARTRDYPAYSRIANLLLAVVSLVITLATVEGWTVANYMGAHAGPMPDSFRDPVFARPLDFYFFDLPLWNMLLNWLAAIALATTLLYYLAARGWQLKRERPEWNITQEFDLRDLLGRDRLESVVFKSMGALFLLALAAKFWLGRYDLLFSDHGNLMVGLDYLEQNIGLAMQIAKAAAAILAAILVFAGRPKVAIAGIVLLLIVDRAVPLLVGAVYVRPNELSLEKPFINRHIAATRSAFGLDRKAREIEYPAQREGRIDFARNRALLDNVRLWDWRAFHDTLNQSQPLRPYTYADTDTDRYVLDGKLRQTLLAPRELDLNQLGDARARWINRALTFTHGYGFVLAEANRISETGLPQLLVQDAPVQVHTKSLTVTRPEIYYGEVSGDPVFVRTLQPEFNYPAGANEVTTRYEGTGGFPVASFGARLAAAVSEGDWNIVLSSALNNESRMIVRRNIVDRVQTLAPFLSFDGDPYLVSTTDGRLQWIIDAYVVSDAHPYSRSVSMPGMGRFNYIRNSVKATVDAYDGSVRFYVFDTSDPLIRAYQNLFPTLFSDAAAMPADLRAHARAPETIFRIQAELYRTYHMRDPESYYNRADLYDLATYSQGAGAEPEPVTPTYLIAELPGEKQPEFLLTIPFTPRNKQNLIGMMAARCDGEHLGELVFLRLPKQEVIEGPLQVEALINQDQNISKDLTLWNQQNSKVLRSQVLSLPIDNTFLYVAPIYIQAAQARMPQLKKIALVQGSTLVYADTYEQALAQLQSVQSGKPVQITSTSSTATPAPVAAPPATTGLDPRIDTVRMHLSRYRELSAQGKWAEAGKELEAVEAAVKK